MIIAPPTVSIVVPITPLYVRSFAAFFMRHGCTFAETDKAISGANLYLITFPPGTYKKRRTQALLARYEIFLPDGTTVEEAQPNMHYSYLYANPDN